MSAEAPAIDRVRVSISQYVDFHQRGFLIIRGLLSAAEIAELRTHTEDLMQGRLPEQKGGIDGLEAPPAHLSQDEKAQHFLRIHMLHRKLQLHERYLLHPRMLDVLQVLIGPDVLAMQSMLFLKPPGKPGQGWHQDSFYIPTHPDTLCGAWAAIDDVDEENGAMWFAQGSHVEPIYPPREGYGYGDRLVADLPSVNGVSNSDDAHNDLAPVADKYPQVLAIMKAGDVAFFGGHILHRSKRNFSSHRYRRSFVGHYCNARAYTQWGADIGFDNVHRALCQDPVTRMTNGSHILARGDTHLPFAKPRFGTPCAALVDPQKRRDDSQALLRVQADTAGGMMDMVPAKAP